MSKSRFWDNQKKRFWPKNSEVTYHFYIYDKKIRGYCNNNNQYSIHCHSTFGPAFGGGPDLGNNNGHWYCYPTLCSSYPKIDDIQRGYGHGSYFNVDDYEVFQVVKM